MELSPHVHSCSSSASLSRECPPLPHSPFSDQSHLSFYVSRRAPFSSPQLKIVRPPLMPSRLALRAVQSLQSFDTSATAPEQDLLKELADLKLQMKLKKKALKAQMKEKKKAMKAEGKKKPKKEKEMMTMMGELSSSSSESSDSECEGPTVADARELRMKEAGKMAGAMAAEGGMEERDGDRALSEPMTGKGVGKLAMKAEGKKKPKKEKEMMTMMEESSSSSSESSDSECEGAAVADAGELRMKETGQMAGAMAAEGGMEERDGERALSEPVTGKGVEKLTMESGRMQSEPVVGKGARKLAMEAGMMTNRFLAEDRNVDDFQTFIQPLVAVSVPPQPKHMAHEPVMASRIEVCVGGKCRKAGSQQLLASLKSQQGANQVEAVACKCMGRCAMGINVKVQKQPDSNPLVFSHVRASDADLILNQGFGLGRPPSGLPSLGGCTAPALAPAALRSTA